MVLFPRLPMKRKNCKGGNSSPGIKVHCSGPAVYLLPSLPLWERDRMQYLLCLTKSYTSSLFLKKKKILKPDYVTEENALNCHERHMVTQIGSILHSKIPLREVFEMTVYLFYVLSLPAAIKASWGKKSFHFIS